MKNKIVKLIGTAGVLLFVLSIAIIDFDSPSIKKNFAGYVIMLFSVIFILYYIYMANKSNQFKVMPSYSEKTNLYGILGMFMATTAITIFNTSDSNFFTNWKSYTIGIFSIVFIGFYFYRLYLERKSKNKNYN